MKSKTAKTLGILLIVLSLTSLSAGAYIWLMNTQRNDDKGYTLSPQIKLGSDSVAIVFSDHKFNMKEEVPLPLQIIIDPNNFMTERWSAKNNLGKDIFIGIATADKAHEFCKTMHYKEANDWDIIGGPWEMDFWVNTWLNHPGAEQARPPLQSSIWLASGSGMESAEFEKILVSGDYWVVIMNGDGSAGMDVDLQVAYKTPLLLMLPGGLLIIGLVFGIVGLFLLTRTQRESGLK